MDTAAANTVAARAFVDELVRLGVEDACISPGSRSTPLTIAFAEHPAIRPWLHLDERSAGFFALGLARAKSRPVALVCTSGTAAANYHPAIAEADLSRVPIIACTTDRPPRLRGVGAAQTINQVDMYGPAVRMATDAPVPGEGMPPDEAFRGLAAAAVTAAMGSPPGPVHCNMPFEEPLLASPADHVPPKWTRLSAGAVRFAECAPAPAAVDVAVLLLAEARRPLILAGPETGGLPAEALTGLAQHLDAPIIADVLSGLRNGPHDRSRVMWAHDVTVRDADESLRPDVIVRFGGVPASKQLNQWLAALDCEVILVDYPGVTRDPDRTATCPVDGSPGAVARALCESPRVARERGWCERWIARDRRTGAALLDAAEAISEPFEGRVFPELADLIPAGATLAVGNSMPVRDADSFLPPTEKLINLVCNRGANGIDGVTSAALGAAAAGTGPVVLATGDLSFEHDLAGLWAAHRHNLDLCVVLVNNNGGGIFEFLPQAAHGDLFEEWFGTPHNIDFRPAVEMYGGRYTLAGDWAQFRDSVSGALAGGGLSVVEVRTDRKRNVALHREVWAAAKAAMRAGEVSPAS